MTPGITDRAIRGLLGEWLPENTEPARPLMQLATVDGAGRPDVRSVLLSEWDTSGFYFHTDARSRKVADLGQNPWAAIVLVWPDRARQLTVQGVTEPAEPGNLQRVYAARSPYLRQLAWLNTDEYAQLDTGERETRWAESTVAQDGAAIGAPETWVGFRLRPTRLTFWEGSPVAASRRTEFRAEGDGWTRRLLAG